MHSFLYEAIKNTLDSSFLSFLSATLGKTVSMSYRYSVSVEHNTLVRNWGLFARECTDLMVMPMSYLEAGPPCQG